MEENEAVRMRCWVGGWVGFGWVGGRVGDLYVPVLLSIVELAELDGVLVELGVALEDAAHALTAGCFGGRRWVSWYVGWVGGWVGGLGFVSLYLLRITFPIFFCCCYCVQQTRRVPVVVDVGGVGGWVGWVCGGGVGNACMRG